MARFDVHELQSGGYVVDCQADVLSSLTTRFVVPLLPPAEAPFPAARLNPQFEILGDPHVMVTQFAGAVASRQLGRIVESLAEFESQIMNALDMLLTGY
jgi:toxin CcdB